MVSFASSSSRPRKEAQTRHRTTGGLLSHFPVGPNPATVQGFVPTHGKLLETIGRPGRRSSSRPHLSSTRPHVSAPPFLPKPQVPRRRAWAQPAAAAAAWPNPRARPPPSALYILAPPIHWPHRTREPTPFSIPFEIHPSSFPPSRSLSSPWVMPSFLQSGCVFWILIVGGDIFADFFLLVLLFVFGLWCMQPRSRSGSMVSSHPPI
jgi:hypothetical protein